MRKYHNAGSAGRDWGHMTVEGDVDERGAIFSIVENHKDDGIGSKYTGLVLSMDQCRDLARQLLRLTSGGSAPMIEGDEL